MIIRDSASWRFIDASAFSDAKSRALTLEGGENESHMDHISVSMDKVTKQDVLRLEPMALWQEVCCMIFLGCVGPTGVFTIPVVTALVGYFVVGSVARAFQVLAVVLIPLAVLPQSFHKESLTSWLSHMILKYFSYRVLVCKGGQIMIQQDVGRITKATAEARPQIFVAPPHGVFPYGNVLAMLIWPILTGHHFIGLTASAALRVPLMGQALKAIGCIDAGRKHARHALEHWPYSVGISTGGVAEVFETNAGHECVLLKERIGLVKLAIRTGADLVPVYMFGNTKLLSCWAGEGIPYGRQFLELLSRKVLGFAAILMFGRFVIPIPYRVPVFCVMGKAIPTYHLQCEEPTMEQIQQVQDLLLREMQELFDNHKTYYGWDDAELIIK